MSPPSPKRTTVLVIVPIEPPAVLSAFKTSLPSHYDVLYRPHNEFEQPTQLKIEEDALPTEEDYLKADAMFLFKFPRNLLSIDQVPNLKLIQLSSSGANQLLNTPFWNSIPASHPLILSTASGIHVSTIAEHVIGTSIMLLHQLPRFLLETRNNSHWTKPSQLGFFIREMRGLTMGILGYGHIGREVARLGQALGMTILAATRSGEKAPIGGFLLPGTGDEAGDIPTAWYSTSSPSSLHSFYSSSDVVVNILPSSPATDLFVNETAFRSMKNDALYINVGRGQTNDEDALVRALQAGLEAGSGKGEGEEGELRIAGASIDVTRVEPLAQGNALYTLENVVLTPHVSAFTSKYWELCMEVFRTNLGRVMEKGEGGLNAIRGRGEE